MRRFATIALLALPGLGLIAGGVHELFVLRTGEPAQARVIECHDTAGKYGAGSCTGMWVEGGSLLAGGRVVTGTIDGAAPDDVGKTLDVRLSGGRAYTTSLRMPVLLLGFGFAFLGMWVWVVRGMLRKRAAAAAPTAA